MSRSGTIETNGASYQLSLILQVTLLLFLATTNNVRASTSGPLKNTFDGIIEQFSNRGRIQTTPTQPTTDIEAVINDRRQNSENFKIGCTNSRRRLWKDAAVRMVSSVSVKENTTKERIKTVFEFIGPTGFYYGLNAEQMIPQNKSRTRKPRPPKVEESMAAALEELKIMRLEMEKMRLEMQQLKRKMIGDDDSGYEMDDEASAEIKAQALVKKRREAEKLAAEIESWANSMLEGGEEDGWTRVECSKMVRSSFNEMERTTAFMKWMVDPRGDKADKEDRVKHPCIKCTSTIDAPLEMVCAYLSQPEVSPDYNDVVEKCEDLEEISPHAKICWSSSPQILFIKPRDFVTFCHHRWKADGTQVIVNQACEHPRFPLEKDEKDGKSCRGYALRGANFLSRCPDDPSKTRIEIVACCRPGGGLPDWATKTAVKALAPLEPFKLFHKINDQVIRNKDQIKERLQEIEVTGSSMPPGRSSKPGGFAQLGYACFWPNGGGKEERADIDDFSSESDDETRSTEDGSAPGVINQNQQYTNNNYS